MATAYTSLLGLALPVTGELAGTWGDTVNNSITSLLDSAVAGATTLSTDADVTLTTTTGASNQARQAILLCSGARTGIKTITAPAQSKIYAVVNNTTGGYAVKIVGVGPTTGVTVANGKTAVVVWNGADFVEVAPATATTATNLSGGATGSVPYQSAASTTTFLSLGTAAQVLQVNAGATAPEWVSSTGTGNVVRATSPTLATPTITTSATVPLVIGGTGTTSTLTLRSTSGVGTTGADIVFQTGNNGATEAMRVLNSGNVGIGTSSPAYKLDVNSTGAAVLRISRNSGTDANTGFQINLSSAYWGFGAGSDDSFAITRNTLSFNSLALLKIDASGNVGIGRTPTYQLDVNSTARFNSTIGVGNTAPAASGAGVSFPATQSASSDANTLDDYEEGTFTPTFVNLTTNAGTPTYSGYYTKIGRLVQFVIRIAGGATVSATQNSTYVSNLPFTAAQDSTLAVTTSGDASNLGIGLIQGGTAYMPTWSSKINITISGVYFV